MKFKGPAEIMVCQCGAQFSQPFGSVTSGICDECRSRMAAEFRAATENMTAEETAIAFSAFMRIAFANV